MDLETNLAIDLGFDTPPSKTRIVVAMSGGVDSSVTAALLAEAGYDVVGLTMQLYDQGEVIKKKACCAGIDIYDAKMVADRIGIPHYVLDYESRFKSSVMEEFADSYLAGETPIPCVRCNQTVKFKDMFAMARELGAQALATGHYVQRIMGPNGAEMHRAVDHNRDQSYFLFGTTQEQLDYLRFPIGHLPKTVTREHGERLGLSVAQKPDSQDICFVPDGNYAKVVERLRPGALESGLIIHQDGRIMGEHKGIIHYTIGQRRGLGISDPSGEPLFVIGLDPKSHTVHVGPREALACHHMHLREVNWLGDNSITHHQKIDIQVKIRSAQEPIPAQLVLKDGGKGDVFLKNPEYGVSGGQACVFYDGDRVLGGGWITRV
jgi:tRNA-specific 2-thiouridylase